MCVYIKTDLKNSYTDIDQLGASACLWLLKHDLHKSQTPQYYFSIKIQIVMFTCRWAEKRLFVQVLCFIYIVLY